MYSVCEESGLWCGEWLTILNGIVDVHLMGGFSYINCPALDAVGRAAVHHPALNLTPPHPPPTTPNIPLPDAPPHASLPSSVLTSVALRP